MSVLTSVVGSKPYAVGRKHDCWVVFLLTVYCLLPTLDVYAEDIRDVKPPIDVPGIPWWMWLALILLGTLAALFFNRKNGQVETKTVVIPKTSWDLALERLTELERQNLFAQGKVQEYFVALSDII